MATDIINKDTVAERLGVSPRTIEIWMRKGLLPFIKLTGKAVRFHWPSVERSLVDRQIGGLAR